MISVNIAVFNDFLKSSSSSDIFYFNIDLLQSSFKDITGSNLIISNKYSLASGADFSAKLFGVSMGIKGSKETHIEEILTQKDILMKIIQEKIYSTELLIYKVRLTRYQYKTPPIININENKNFDVTSQSTSPKIRLLKNTTPKKQSSRPDIKKYYTNTFLYLDENFVFGPLKEYLFDDNSIFNYLHLDIESETFYVIYINKHKVFNFNDKDSSYNMLTPLLIIR